MGTQMTGPKHLFAAFDVTRQGELMLLERRISLTFCLSSVLHFSPVAGDR